MPREPGRAGVTEAAPPEVAWLRPPSRPFAVGFERAANDIGVIVLQGELDTYTVTRYKDTVATAIDRGTLALVVDLSEVSFIDAAGLGAIVTTARRLGLGTVAVVLPHPGLVRIFRICRLDRLLDIYETRELALRGLPR